MRQYEAMFLFDSTFAGEPGKTDAEIERILNRADAEIIVSRKWDERRLAYEIKRHKRGCYVLTYFRAEPDRIAGIERDGVLSESVLRMIVVRADDISRSRIDAMYPALPAAAKSAAAAGEGPQAPSGTVQAAVAAPAEGVEVEVTAKPAGVEADVTVPPAEEKIDPDSPTANAHAHADSAQQEPGPPTNEKTSVDSTDL
ncbi:MAG: 30S ribosomal protein S6 [Phycisphaerae bacterium]